MNSFVSSSDSLTVGQQEEVRGNDGPVVQTKLSAFNICIQGLRDEMGTCAGCSVSTHLLSPFSLKSLLLSLHSSEPTGRTPNKPHSQHVEDGEETMVSF